MKMILYLVILPSVLFSLSSAGEPFIVKFQWNYLNFTWPSYEAYSTATTDGSYIAKNNIISGIKLWKDKMYLTVPRYKNGVPVTLAVTSSTVQNGTTAPLLEPYPNWAMQKIADCSAFQTVQNMEIDPKGRMWVLDSGRVATMTLDSKASCSPRLVILDLENNGNVLRSYRFPADVINPNTAILNDIVIDHEDGGYAYITNSDEQDPGLVVYSLANNTSWKVGHFSMFASTDPVGFSVDNVSFNDKVNIHGIALSPASTKGGKREVYFNPLSSFVMYAVPTKALKDAVNETEREKIGEHIRTLGRKPSPTDGMLMSNTGKMYFGLLADNGVSMWDSKTNQSFVVGQKRIVKDDYLLQWPASFAFDDNDQLWLISNRMHRYRDDSIDINRANYRIIVSRVDMRGYQYYPDGTTPELPAIAFIRYGK